MENPKEEPNYNMKQEIIAEMERLEKEPKQETLEEAAKNYVNYCAYNISEDEDLADADKRGFIYGAKWQQDRSYSEEEVLKLLVKMNEWSTTFNGEEEVEEWFEQFKKK